jgi:hypothetical protein
MIFYTNPGPDDPEVVGFASETGLSYEFHEFAVLRRGGLYYWSSDRGCSCPMPWEDHAFPDDFQSGNAIEALNALDTWSKGITVEDDGLRTKLMNVPIIIKEAA